MAEPVCLTCTKETDLGSSVTVGTREEVQGALSKHFWFSENEYLDSSLCTGCWSQIEDFNRFYCEIEQIHSEKRQNVLNNFVEIKQEPVGGEDEETEQVLVKMEAEVEDECYFEQELEPDIDQDSSGEEENQSNKEAIAQYIKENIKFDCTNCSKQFGTFEDLRSHSLGKHDQRAYAFCCGNKYSQKSKLSAHVLFHVNPAGLQCSFCAKQFRTRRTLTQHQETAHTSEEEKVLQCPVCPKKFALEKHLKMHEKYHRKLDEKKWHCATCEKYFPYESTLRQHNRVVHRIEEPVKVEGENVEEKEGRLKSETDPDEGEPNEKQDDISEYQANLLKKRKVDNDLIAQHITLECDTCSTNFDTFELLQKHSTMEHSKRAMVSCCDTSFSQKSSLIDHIRYHVDPDQLRCEICSKQFRQLRALNFHRETAHKSQEDAVFECGMCPKKFTTAKHLKIHQKYHLRLNERKWHCESCNQYFAYESILKQHHKSVHSKDTLYVCHICAKEYHIYSSYTSHVASHDESGLAKDKPPEEKLQCPECATWVSKKGLRRHMLRHTGSQTCGQCGHECRSAMALRYHLAQHRKGDFGCTLCDKTFKAQLTLKEHMATHTGEVLYRCDFCDKTFNSHANRASHRKKMHPKEWLEDKMRKAGGTVAAATSTQQQPEGQGDESFNALSFI